MLFSGFGLCCWDGIVKMSLGMTASSCSGDGLSKFW